MTAGRRILASRRGLTVVLAMTLAGCQLRPEALVPSPASPADWREGAAASSWPAQDWWRAFGSDELDALIAEAERNNQDLAAAEARVREADAQARIAGAPLLPSLALQANPTAQHHLNQIGRERHYQDLPGALAASYELDVWGKNRAARDAAVFSAQATRYDRQVVNVTLVAGVASTYFQLLGLRQQLTAAKANLAGAEKVLLDIQTVQRAGLATQVQVVQQQTVVESLTEQLPPLQQQEASALDALAVLVGQSPEAIHVVGADLMALKTPVLDVGLPSLLLAHLPDVQAAERRLAAANANITVARAQFLPDFNLSASGGIEAEVLTSGVAGPEVLYNIALNAVQPIFQGGRLRGQLQLNRAQKAELLADYLKTTQQAYADVEDALAAVRATQQQQQADQRTLDQANASLSLTHIAYQGGNTDILPVLSAEAAAFPDRLAVYQARVAHLQSLVALYRALGGGWTLQS